MKNLLQIASILPVLAFAANAQDESRMRAMKAEAEVMQMKVQAVGAVKGLTVKGAPYSGEEINETNNVLADGTRIHRETRTMVYRDSEGRTRRETPENITIVDPVSNTTWILNPKTMSGQKLQVSSMAYSYIRKETSSPSAGVSAGGDGNTTFTMKVESDGGNPTIIVNGKTLDPKEVQELIAKAKANGESVTVNHLGFETHEVAAEKMAVAGALAGAKVLARRPFGESLGTRIVEGVNAEGMRNVNTIKAGSIGNDRDITVTGESWYSPELQTTVMSKHSDPRTGEESFRLANISRNEPGAYLFQPPAGYSINERK